MERQLVNEYVKLFKKVYGISDEKWKVDSFYKPLKSAIENFTDEFLNEKISSLKQWAIKEEKI